MVVQVKDKPTETALDAIIKKEFYIPVTTLSPMSIIKEVNITM